MSALKLQTNAPVGEWISPISSEVLTQGARKLADARWVSDDELIWLEGRPSEAGRVVLVSSKATAPVARDVTPGPESGLNVRTTVHEYGGGDYLVVGTGNGKTTAYFSNFKDQRVWAQALSSAQHTEPQEPKPVTADGTGMRFADYIWDAHRSRLLAVCETHKEGASVMNTIATVDPVTGGVAMLASGHDFYAMPRISPDGKHLSFVAWDFPNMPWDGTYLYTADFQADGTLGPLLRVAGCPDEAVQQPVWSSTSSCLYFITDASGYWNISAWEGGKVRTVCTMAADFGWPMWVFGHATYTLVDDTHILALLQDPKVAGVSCALIDVSTGKAHRLDTGFTSLSSITKLDVRHTASGQLRVACVCAGPLKSSAVVVLTVDSVMQLLTSKPSDWSIIRTSSEITVPLEGYLSSPQSIEFPTEGGKTAFMVYYPPCNKDFKLPPGQLPPLLVKSHGGPTSAASVMLNLGIQYFTSRGFAVADVNYGGSTGYGREYRNRLRGSWGIVDVDDCCNAAKHLASEGLVDIKRLCISGGSAGGFTTLACLAFRSVFSAGASLYGVADLGLLAADTHKFESRYLDLLVGPYPAEKQVYNDRSPINHADGFKSPIIFFQGDEDKVVPPEQSIKMHDAVRGKGLPTALVMLKGEQHGFRQAASIRIALDGELYFYGRVLGFKSEMPADLPSISVDNLGDA